MTRRLPEVTVYCGPMGAGKTTRLFGKMGELDHIGIPFAAFRPGVDVRDQVIAPRGYTNNHSVDQDSNCLTVESLDMIPAEDLASQGTRTIVMEEWFMFGFDKQRQPISGLYLRTMGRWATAGIDRVFAAGLDLAANGEQFGLVADARKYGAKVVNLVAKCEYPLNGDENPKCGKTARNSQIYDARDKKVFDMETLPSLLPEGIRPHDRYRAACAEHLILAADKTKAFSSTDTDSEL